MYEVKWCESCLVMSDSLWPHGLYSSWNPPGQNSNLSLLQKVKWSEVKWNLLSHVRLWDPHELYSPCNSSSLNTGVGCLFLLQRISPTQGSNLGLPHCKQILYQLSHKGRWYSLVWIIVHPISYLHGKEKV